MFIDYNGKEGDTKRYTLTSPYLSTKPITVFSTPGKSPQLVQDGTSLDPELSQLILDEVRTWGTELAKGNANDPLVGTIEEIVGPVYEHTSAEQEAEVPTRVLANDDIRAAFNPGWYGTPDTRQKEVMAKFGLRYERGTGKHGKIISPRGHIPASCTPGDLNTGRQLARQILKYLL